MVVPVRVGLGIAKYHSLSHTSIYPQCRAHDDLLYGQHSLIFTQMHISDKVEGGIIENSSLVRCYAVSNRE